jgi:hypothetical protein
MSNNARHPKISGKRLHSLHGLTVYADLRIPKRRGKARLQIQIRQDKGFDWRVEQCLNYGRSLDVLFATETMRNREGLIG